MCGQHTCAIHMLLQGVHGKACMVVSPWQWLKHQPTDMRRDMRVANIMEHRQSAETMLPKGFAGNKKRNVFKLPGKHITRFAYCASVIADCHEHK